MSGGVSFVHPRRDVVARCATRLVGCQALLKARRALMSRLPFVVLESDVVDVVYATWVVDAARVAGFAPPGVRLWQREGRTLFTILSYRHGGFGPRIAGPLRRLLPSPLQSNWRLYVDALPAGTPAERVVLFTGNVLDSGLHVVAARLASDALPSHLSARFVHAPLGDGFETRIEAGAGSAPELHARFAASGTAALPNAFAPLFDDWAAALDFICLQHAAIVPVEGTRRLALAGIELPIDLASVRPLDPLAISGGAELRAMIGDDSPPPLCFVAPRVNFRVVSERLLPG